MTDTELIIREIDQLRRDMRDGFDSLKRDHDELESEVSELKLQAARAGGPSIKRDTALAGGSATVTAALLALVQWLTSTPPPRAERFDRGRDRGALQAPAPAPVPVGVPQ